MKRSELKQLIKESIAEMGGLITNRAMLIPDTPFNSKPTVNEEDENTKKYNATKSNAYKVIYQGENATVIEPGSVIGMATVSKGAKWDHPKDWFDRFSKMGKVFVILTFPPAGIERSEVYEKYALIVFHTGEWKMYNIENKEVDADKTLASLKLDKSIFEK
jgi:hypothetical protein